MLSDCKLGKACGARLLAVGRGCDSCGSGGALPPVIGLGLLAFRTVHPDRVPFGDIDWGSLLAGGWAFVHSALERDRRVDVGLLVREEQVVGFLGFGVGEHKASAFDASFDAAGARDRLFHTACVLLRPDRGARGETEKESQ